MLQMGWARPVAFAGLALFLSACAPMDPVPSLTSSPSAPDAAADSSGDAAPSARTNTSPIQARTASAQPTAQPRYVSESDGWSIALPAGWEAVSPNGMFASSGGGAIAEVLVGPSWGLTVEELETRTLEDLGAWPEAVQVEAELVRLPAGDAVLAALEMNGPEHGPAVFILYRIDDGDRLYAISVRGPGDGADLLPIAEALAESFVVTTD